MSPFAKIKTTNAVAVSAQSEVPCSSAWKYVRLLYPNGVSLLLHYDIASKNLSRFINLDR